MSVQPFAGLVYTPPENGSAEQIPEKNLKVAVIRQAILDLQRGDEEERENADNYIHSDGFVLDCAEIGLNPVAVWERIGLALDDINVTGRGRYERKEVERSKEDMSGFDDVIEVLRTAGRPLELKEVMVLTGQLSGPCSGRLSAMSKDGRLVKIDRGKEPSVYALPEWSEMTEPDPKTARKEENEDPVRKKHSPNSIPPLRGNSLVPSKLVPDPPPPPRKSDTTNSLIEVLSNLRRSYEELERKCAEQEEEISRLRPVAEFVDWAKGKVAQ